jgi:hypothetical protein
MVRTALDRAECQDGGVGAVAARAEGEEEEALVKKGDVAGTATTEGPSVAAEETAGKVGGAVATGRRADEVEALAGMGAVQTCGIVNAKARECKASVAGRQVNE